MAALLTACAAGPQPGRDQDERQPPLPALAALSDLVGEDAASVTAALGPPDLERREGAATVLQFRGETCILDVILYDDAAQHAEARGRTGEDVDANACLRDLTDRRAIAS